jgi:hypothetical protein
MPGVGDFYFCWKPAGVVLQCVTDFKDELGWADFQVRSDVAIRRHQALVSWAFCFCWDAWFADRPPEHDAAAPPPEHGRGKRGAAPPSPGRRRPGRRRCARAADRGDAWPQAQVDIGPDLVERVDTHRIRDVPCELEQPVPSFGQEDRSLVPHTLPS